MGTFRDTNVSYYTVIGEPVSKGNDGLLPKLILASNIGIAC